MQLFEVFKRSKVINHQVRVKLDHFDYFKGKIVPGVSLGCSLVQDGNLKGKIGLLSFFILKKWSAGEGLLDMVIVG